MTKILYFPFATKGYSRKKYLGGEDGRRYIFLWVVGAESFQIIWVIGVRPNRITWVVGILLRGRGRKNIICPKKREVLSNLAQRKRRALQTAVETAIFCLYAIVKTWMFPLNTGKKWYQNKLPNSGFCSGHYFAWETCIFRRIYSRKQRYMVVRLLVKPIYV